ncbi:hypothetical protein MMC06_000437 [Schaereria dolodes]|nr:hypothetical protein [Schaereria dolodes]
MDKAQHRASFHQVEEQPVDSDRLPEHAFSKLAPDSIHPTVPSLSQISRAELDSYVTKSVFPRGSPWYWYTLLKEDSDDQYKDTEKHPDYLIHEWSSSTSHDFKPNDVQFVRTHPREFTLPLRSTNPHMLGKRASETDLYWFISVIPVMLFITMCINSSMDARRRAARAANRDARPHRGAVIPAPPTTTTAPSIPPVMIGVMPEDVAAVQALKLAAFPVRRTEEASESEQPPVYVPVDMNLPDYTAPQTPERAAISDSRGDFLRAAQADERAGEEDRVERERREQERRDLQRNVEMDSGVIIW